MVTLTDKDKKIIKIAIIVLVPLFSFLIYRIIMKNSKENEVAQNKGFSTSVLLPEKKDSTAELSNLDDVYKREEQLKNLDAEKRTTNADDFFSEGSSEKESDIKTIQEVSNDDVKILPQQQVQKTQPVQSNKSNNNTSINRSKNVATTSATTTVSKPRIYSKPNSNKRIGERSNSDVNEVTSSGGFYSSTGNTSNNNKQNNNNNNNNNTESHTNNNVDNEIEIPAVVHGTTTVRSGQQIKLRVNKDFTVNGAIVKKGAFVYGVIGITNERVTVKISSVNTNKGLVSVNYYVKDTHDGLAGIYIPGGINQDLRKKGSSTANSLANNIPIVGSTISNNVQAKINDPSVTINTNHTIIITNK
jgi:hypothetical protein